VPAADLEMQHRREAAIDALIEIEQSLDFSRLATIFPQPRYELIGSSRVYAGADEVGRYLRERRSAFPDYRVEIVSRYHAAAAVIAEMWVTGTYAGRLGDVEAGPKGFRFRMAGFFLFDGDRLTCFRNYYDRAAIARQLA
jgi:predicted ester cyclase